MAALPEGRLAYRQRPFSHCRLDYFGPMSVKIGRRQEKRWGALFTCLTTRVIHLELAHSLSSDSAIMALRRFTATRGTPSHLYCDNGTNFRGMSVELTRAIREIDNSKIETFTNLTSFGNLIPLPRLIWEVHGNVSFDQSKRH